MDIKKLDDNSIQINETVTAVNTKIINYANVLEKIEGLSSRINILQSELDEQLALKAQCENLGVGKAEEVKPIEEVPILAVQEEVIV